MHELFRIVCFEYRVVTVEYFMDRMPMYEVYDIVKNIEYLDKNSRELDRYKLYVAIQANSTSKIDIEDVMKLPWDKSEIMKSKQIVPEADDEEKYNQMEKWYLDAMKEGKIKFNEAKLM